MVEEGGGGWGRVEEGVGGRREEGVAAGPTATTVPRISWPTHSGYDLGPHSPLPV